MKVGDDRSCGKHDLGSELGKARYTAIYLLCEEFIVFPEIFEMQRKFRNDGDKWIGAIIGLPRIYTNCGNSFGDLHVKGKTP